MTKHTATAEFKKPQRSARAVEQICQKAKTLGASYEARGELSDMVYTHHPELKTLTISATDPQPYNNDRRMAIRKSFSDLSVHDVLYVLLDDLAVG